MLRWMQFEYCWTRFSTDIQHLPEKYSIYKIKTNATDYIFINHQTLTNKKSG